MPINRIIGITILVLINVVLLSSIWISSHELDTIALINMKVRVLSFVYLLNKRFTRDSPPPKNGVSLVFAILPILIATNIICHVYPLLERYDPYGYWVSFAKNPLVTKKVRDNAPAPWLSVVRPRLVETALHSGYSSRADMSKELKAVCSTLLGFSELEVVPDAKYWHADNDIIDSYGVQFLDALCCAEIDLWLEEPNQRIGVPISPPLFS